LIGARAGAGAGADVTPDKILDVLLSISSEHLKLKPEVKFSVKCSLLFGNCELS
jgi:hypothetical protein